MRSRPFGDFTYRVDVSHNQLSGTLGQEFFAEAAHLWQCSENLWEGTLPQRLPRRNRHDDLLLCSVSGKVGAGTHLYGALPQGLGRARKLAFFMAHNQVLEGNVQALRSTLRVLALQANLLKSLSGIAFAKDHAVILLHNNLLSCHLPKSDRTLPDLSLVAIGNHLRHPDGDFPSWVSPIERDDLFWTSEWEGLDFIVKVLACSLFFVSVVGRWLGMYNLQCTILSWRDSGYTSSQCISRWYHLMACQALRSTASLMLLLDWDFYLCPRTLALASACLHENRCVHLLVLLLWTRPVAWPAVASQEMLHSKVRSATGETEGLTLRRCFLWLLWLQLALLLSSLVVLDLAVTSVPGLLSLQESYFKRTMSRGMGSTQGLLSSMIIPSLARKFAFSKYPCIRPGSECKALNEMS